MRRRYTILLVEDNSDDVILMRRALRGIGIKKRLIAIPDGGLAVQYLSGAGEFEDRRRYPLPNLVLLDLKLRGLSGFEVLQWIRLDPSLNRLPVVVITASVYSADVARAYKLGANSFVSKLNDAAQFSAMLKDTVLTWLGARQGAAASAASQPPSGTNAPPPVASESEPRDPTDRL